MSNSKASRAQAIGRALQQAVAAHAQGRFAVAAQHCAAVLEADPDNFDGLHLLAVTRSLQGAHAEADRLLKRAVPMQPDRADVHYHHGRVLSELKRFDEAITSYRRSLSIDPHSADAHLYLALALRAVGRTAEAQASYRTSLYARKAAFAKQAPGFLPLYLLGIEFEDFGDLDAALDCCRDALKANPEWTRARGALAMYQLPTIFENVEAVAASRAAFTRELAGLTEWLDEKKPADGFEAFQVARVFHLAYQEQNNLPLLSAYGDLCARTMQRWQDEAAIQPSPRGDARKLRLGIVMANTGNDSVWNAIVKGWIQHLDRSRFDVHLSLLESANVDWPEALASQTTRHDLSQKTLKECATELGEQSLDVLIYPEVGMNRKVAVLASLRLAPVQAASWGHPETTGLPTIDYFLSGEDLEPAHAQQYYRERLVRLPQLGCCIYPALADQTEVDLESLGIRADRPVLVCAGTPFKYAPQFDPVLVEIARELGPCQFVFFDYESRRYLSEKLRQRLEASFDESGLRLDEHAVFVPWLDRARFLGLLSRSTLYLDTIGFSGFNTALQAVECGLPVVTREGRFMRGRLASGILKRMGLPELVAANEEEYVALAVKIARDATYRDRLRSRIAASRHALFENVAAVRALEQFCEKIV